METERQWGTLHTGEGTGGGGASLRDAIVERRSSARALTERLRQRASKGGKSAPFGLTTPIRARVHDAEGERPRGGSADEQV